MKLVCKQGFWPASDGFLGIGATPRKPIGGLTEGKSYTAELVPIACHFSQGTDIAKSDIKAMVYNDNEEWEVYQLNLFVPQEDK